MSDGVVAAYNGNQFLASGNLATVPAPIYVRMLVANDALTKALVLPTAYPWWTGALSNYILTPTSVERRGGNDDILVSPYGDSNLEVWGQFPAITSQEVELGLTRTPEAPLAGRVMYMLTNNFNAVRSPDPNGPGVPGIGLYAQITRYADPYGPSPFQPPNFTALGGFGTSAPNFSFGMLVRNNGATATFLRTDTTATATRQFFTGGFSAPFAGVKLYPYLRIVGNRTIQNLVIRAALPVATNPNDPFYPNYTLTY